MNFKSKKMTPGQNLIDTIGGTTSVGILKRDHDKVIDILNMALEPDEVDLLCRGFGIGRPRQSQTEIAEELHSTNISVRARKAVQKLKSNKRAVNRLIGLVPSVSEIESAMADAEKFRACESKLTELEVRSSNFDEQLARKDAEIERLSGENEKFEKAKREAESCLEASEKARLKCGQDLKQAVVDSEMWRRRYEDAVARYNEQRDKYDQLLSKYEDLLRLIGVVPIEMIEASDRIAKEFKTIEGCINELWKASDTIQKLRDETSIGGDSPSPKH